MTAARVLNPAETDAQFERSRCAIWGGILIHYSERKGHRIGLNWTKINKSAETALYGTQKMRFIACGEHIRCLWGRIFTKKCAILFFGGTQKWIK
jgi:hypothetical protein